MTFNFDPSAGSTNAVCVSGDWIPILLGLLSEGDTDEFWKVFASIRGDTFDSDYAYLGRSGLAQIMGAFGRGEFIDEGCVDNSPGTPLPVYGTLYSKAYSFAGSTVPTGWTVTRGTPDTLGLKTANFHAGPGWLRSIGATLALAVQCHPVSYLHTSYMNLSPLANVPLFLGGYFFSGNSRLSAQSEPLPEGGTWNMQITNTLQAATANQVQVNIQIDSLRTGESDLLGDAWLQSLQLYAYSSLGNPFP